jgi:hypothetical protein
MQVYRYNLSDIKVGNPIHQTDFELTQEGFSRTCFPGGTSHIQLETTSIVYMHQDGRRARVELVNGEISKVETFRMKTVFPRLR